MARILSAIVIFAILYGCAQANSPVERQEKQEGFERATEEQQPTRNVEEATTPETAPRTPEVSTPRPRVDYEIIEVEEFENDPLWNDGPLAERGMQGAHLTVRVEDFTDMQPAYADVARTRTEYEVMILTFYVGDELMNEWYYARTPSAEQAFLAEVAQNQEETVE